METYKSIRKRAIKLIKELKRKEKSHWKKLDKSQYINFPKTKTEDAYGFTFKDHYFSCWHEANDVYGAIIILKILFNLKPEELK